MGQLSVVLKLDIILHNWNFGRGRAWVGERCVNQSPLIWSAIQISSSCFLYSWVHLFLRFNSVRRGGRSGWGVLVRDGMRGERKSFNVFLTSGEKWITEVNGKYLKWAKCQFLNHGRQLVNGSNYR
jgi:hypothetical protein